MAKVKSGVVLLCQSHWIQNTAAKLVRTNDSKVTHEFSWSFFGYSMISTNFQWWDTIVQMAYQIYKIMNEQWNSVLKSGQSLMVRLTSDHRIVIEEKLCTILFLTYLTWLEQHTLQQKHTSIAAQANTLVFKKGIVTWPWQVGKHCDMILPNC